MRFFATLVLAAVTAVPSLVFAQLSGSIGPTTSTGAKKSKKLCNVLDYGAKADGKTDLGPALTKAWNACATGGLGQSLQIASSLLQTLTLQCSCRLVPMPWRPGQL